MGKPRFRHCASTVVGALISTDYRVCEIEKFSAFAIIVSTCLWGSERVRILERLLKTDWKFWYASSTCMRQTGHDTVKAVFYSQGPPVGAWAGL